MRKRKAVYSWNKTLNLTLWTDRTRLGFVIYLGNLFVALVLGWLALDLADEPHCWGCPVHWPGSGQCAIIVRVVFAALIGWRSVVRNHAEKEVSLREASILEATQCNQLFNKRHTHVLFCRCLPRSCLPTDGVWNSTNNLRFPGRHSMCPQWTQHFLCMCLHAVHALCTQLRGIQ